MKVYVVTQGCYSDFHICEIFATEEAAKTYCEEANYFDEYDPCFYYAEEVSERVIKKEDKPCWIRCEFTNEVFDEDCGIQILDYSFEESKELDVDKYEYEDDAGYKFIVIGLCFPMVARKDETLEQFKDRAKKVAIDKYYQWKQEVSNV